MYLLINSYFAVVKGTEGISSEQSVDGHDTLMTKI